MADRPAKKTGSTAVPPPVTRKPSAGVPQKPSAGVPQKPSAGVPQKPSAGVPQKPSAGASRTGSTAVPSRSAPAGTAAPVASAKEVKLAARSAKRTERARKKASTDPADMGRIKQVRRAYQLTHEYDRRLPYLMLGALLLPILLGVAIGALTDHLIYVPLLGLMVGVLLAMIMLVRRAKGATYRRYAGQAGSAEVALGMLPKQWLSSPVIAANRNSDVVHRTLGPGGLVLIGEGEPGRVRQLLTSEVRKHERVAYGVAVHTIVMGDKQGQVPLSRLADHIRKLPKTLQANQVTDVRARLRALDAVRPAAPLPKGPMPTSARQSKGSRQAMRGR